MVGGKALLYIGIAPDKASKPNSRQSLLHRIRYHYQGNAEGSTLRRTLGVLLEEKSGFPLRRVGSGERITLTHAGERYLQRVNGTERVCRVGGVPRAVSAYCLAVFLVR